MCGGGRVAVKDMCYEVRRAEACVDSFAHHALVNARERDIVSGVEPKSAICVRYAGVFKALRRA